MYNNIQKEIQEAIELEVNRLYDYKNLNITEQQENNRRMTIQGLQMAINIMNNILEQHNHIKM
jgi:predicted DNA-binding protein (UPF0251 family)